nr:immunoglobulin light chain junction region [Macaca mulatta]MOV72773.1 immunoglobulin light chain junction region [Macaca mulatta]MOV73844.1 immunoglobulin light chain junction region [Macaca mulatta]
EYYCSSFAATYTFVF